MMDFAILACPMYSNKLTYKRKFFNRVNIMINISVYFYSWKIQSTNNEK